MNGNQMVRTSIAPMMFGLLLGAALLSACEGDPGAPGAALAGPAQQSPGDLTLGHPHLMPPIGAGDSKAPTGIHPDDTTYDLSYHGGTGGVGVETTPRVYLVFWGSQWSSDPSGEESILQNFFNGIGGSAWNALVTQYCQGLAYGTYYCNGAGQSIGNPTGLLAGVWSDNGSAAPSQPTDAQIAAEAVSAAAHFGNTTAASNASVQYFVATSTGNSTAGFGCGGTFCAYHSNVTSTNYGNVAYVDFPYQTDSTCCGTNWNGLGANAGITITASHEFAEAETDQFPGGGWFDSNGSEIGDKCAFISSGQQGAAADITLSTGTFPVQSLWSNASNGGSGACVLANSTFKLDASPLSKVGDVCSSTVSLSFTLTATLDQGASADTVALYAAGLPDGSVTFNPTSISTNGGTSTATFTMPSGSSSVIPFTVNGVGMFSEAWDPATTSTYTPTFHCPHPTCLCPAGYKYCNNACILQGACCTSQVPEVTVAFSQ